jgi:hypothetical protein
MRWAAATGVPVFGGAQKFLALVFQGLHRVLEPRHLAL